MYKNGIQIKSQAFTIMELMVVVVLLAVIAAFALPDYSRTLDRSHERDMETQLSALHAANEIYFAQTDTYWDEGGGGESTLSTINNALNISVISNDGTTYFYEQNSDTTYTATATWRDFTLTLTEAALSGSNPTCSGSCPP